MVVAKCNADLEITLRGWHATASRQRVVACSLCVCTDLLYGGSRRMTDGALGNIGVGGMKASLVRRTFGEHDGCTSGDTVD